MELIKSRKFGNVIENIYECGGYIINYFFADNNGTREMKDLEIICKEERMPEITYDSWDTKEFRIQTTSYGSLVPDEINKVIEGLQEAQEVVKTIKANLMK